jgi:hypothetical protein
MTWRAGDAVVLREIWDGKVWEARAATVVEDSGRATMLYVPPHAAKKRAVDRNGIHQHIPLGEWTHTDGNSSYRHVLSFAWPDRAYSVLMSWHPTGNKFLGWYVNFQTPLKRTSIGFDATDHILDIVIDTTHVWKWKDQDELKIAVDRGLVSEQDAEGFHTEGERALEKIRSREDPFDNTWMDWRADPAWVMPEIPSNWDKPNPD